MLARGTKLAEAQGSKMSEEIKERPRPHKILVVDDDPLVHRLYQHHLQRAGCQMLSANNGQEALALAARELPDLIVLDVMMAGMDGLTVLRALKKTDTTRAIPVLVITANPHQMTQRESELSGAAGFLTKPFSPNQLLGEIRRLLPM